MKTLHTQHRSTHATPRAWLLRSALALAVVAALPMSAQTAHAGVFVSVNFAPPVLPVYEQPAIPGDGYIWTPGYWAYDPDDGYYWVPGTWVEPPYVGALWTPGYWGYVGGVYTFNAGYWGRHVGWYGGINYGYGYTGVGYAGGYWGEHGGFFYNREVNHITDVHITNVYNRTVVNNTVVNRTSFNGPGGITTHATPQEQAFSREAHTAPVAAQVQHQTLARETPQLRATENHGAPSAALAASARPAAFAGHAPAAQPNPSTLSRTGPATSTSPNPSTFNRTGGTNNTAQTIHAPASANPSAFNRSGGANSGATNNTAQTIHAPASANPTTFNRTGGASNTAQTLHAPTQANPTTFNRTGSAATAQTVHAPTTATQPAFNRTGGAPQTVHAPTTSHTVNSSQAMHTNTVSQPRTFNPGNQVQHAPVRTAQMNNAPHPPAVHPAPAPHPAAVQHAPAGGHEEHHR